MEGYDPKVFWDERCLRHGHTGEIDGLLYAYDQKQRLKAIGKALSRSRVRMNAGTKILDIGCGTGDLISLFVRCGELDITGIDLSDEVINCASSRFADSRNIRLSVMAVENMEFPVCSFDLVTGINVLQHIIDEDGFSRAIENTVRVVRSGGHILTMDFSPVKVRGREPASYLIIRSRNEYIRAFEDNGCKLIYEFGLPRIGVRLYGVISRATAKLMKLLPRAETSRARENNMESEPAEPAESVFLRIYNLVRTMALKLAKPFDNLLAPFPSRYTDMRILIFEKTVVCGQLDRNTS